LAARFDVLSGHYAVFAQKAVYFRSPLAPFR
jgi:hypothetical protein